MISQGLYTALITPFDDQGHLDEGGLRRLIQFQKNAGVDGLLVLGVTGEAPTLTQKEQRKIVEIAKDEADKTTLIAGASFASTQEVIQTVKWLEDYEVDAVLITQPFFNKPTQEGIFRHFEAICSVSKIPVLVYNHQGRTGVNIETPTLARIVKLPGIIGVKESSGDSSQVGDVISRFKSENPHFRVFSGEDSKTLTDMALGADGVISVVSNLIPAAMKELVHFMLKRDLQSARALHFRYLPLFKASFFETNPIPIKAAMQLSGLPSGSPRLPLTPLSSAYSQELEKVLENLEILTCMAS